MVSLVAVKEKQTERHIWSHWALFQLREKTIIKRRHLDLGEMQTEYDLSRKGIGMGSRKHHRLKPVV